MFLTHCLHGGKSDYSPVEPLNSVADRFDVQHCRIMATFRAFPLCCPCPEARFSGADVRHMCQGHYSGQFRVSVKKDWSTRAQFRPRGLLIHALHETESGPRDGDSSRRQAFAELHIIEMCLLIAGENSLSSSRHQHQLARISILTLTVDDGYFQSVPAVNKQPSRMTHGTLGSNALISHQF